LEQAPLNADSRPLEFLRVLIPESTIEVPDGDMRPGVERLYTLPFVLNQPLTLVQVSVAICYNRDKPPINRVDKIFSLIPAPKS
jgi:hypothetical protein